MLIITEAGNEYLVSHYTCCSSLFILEIFSEKKLAEESDDNQMQCVILDRILVLKNCLQTIAKKQKSYVAFTETGFYLLSLIWVQTYCGEVIKHMPFPSFEIHLPPPPFFSKNHCSSFKTYLKSYILSETTCSSPQQNVTSSSGFSPYSFIISIFTFHYNYLLTTVFLFSHLLAFLSQL